MNDLFVSFRWTKKDGERGNGDCSMPFPNPVSSSEEIAEIKRYIKEESGVDNVAIINFRRMEDESTSS